MFSLSDDRVEAMVFAVPVYRMRLGQRQQWSHHRRTGVGGRIVCVRLEGLVAAAAVVLDARTRRSEVLALCRSVGFARTSRVGYDVHQGVVAVSECNFILLISN